MNKKFIILIGAVLLLIPYIWVESLTYLYGDKFRNIERAGIPKESIEYLKVFSYSNEYAKLFIVDNNSNINMGCRAGSYFEYKKSEPSNKWELVSWGGGWSECGSADSWTFPPYF